MIKKIQKYLLLHYPLVWNTRFVPMMLILLIVHLVVFALSYILTQHTIREYYNYSFLSSMDIDNYFTLSFLIGVLLLIGWLAFYSRNNGLSSFYPRKTSQLYLEWVMIFIISIGICCTPLTMMGGHILKWRSMASLEEIGSAINTLNKVDMLISTPSENSGYDRFDYDSEDHQPIPIPKGMDIEIDDYNRSDFEYHYDYTKPIKVEVEVEIDEYDEEYEGYGIEEYYTAPEYPIIVDGYIGSSLLFFSYKSDIHLEVEKWLREGRKDQIMDLMLEVEALHKKHKLNALLASEWFERVYNPPFFPVDHSTYIYNKYVYDGSYPYLYKKELLSAYEHAREAYVDLRGVTDYILFFFCFSLYLSVAIFSYRVTSGKSWLIAFIATGIILFVGSFVAILLANAVSYPLHYGVFLAALLFWIITFIVLFATIQTKIVRKFPKGKSKIYINVLVWLVPCIIPLCVFSIWACSELTKEYDFIGDEDVLKGFWINFPVTIVAMWFVARLLRQWKSIAEE
ncbi:hypothetical protein [Bacteroides sp. 519]|uniref:hypothetical protein n=1 Tax=Bacteroides sp. 519 TaxID=2302937 RepID=UPI0013D6C258|nr:hypothetical protein [Bacteroides sp. 519]NDV57835.1 hypothetical protein [Bacteroides sp. 519]